jgi:hypothetical protein
MSEKEQFVAEEVESIQQDPALEYSLEMGFDLMEIQCFITPRRAEWYHINTME